MKVFDERLNFISDPQDPEGGFPPFYDGFGLPIPKVNWITNGILTDLAYDAGYASRIGKQWNDKPHSIRVQGSDPAQAATIEEMISNCKDGVFVNRFTGVDLIDLKTGVMTGYTRDGCFHVKDGKINKPIKNYRFTYSPMIMFNSLMMIGKSERVACGYNPGYGRSIHLPIICPPLMIRDFNFSGLSDAV